MSDDLYAGLMILAWMINIVVWSVVLADTKVGEWMTGNPVSRRFILPVWDRIKGGVRWVGEKVTR